MSKHYGPGILKKKKKGKFYWGWHRTEFRQRAFLEEEEGTLHLCSSLQIKTCSQTHSHRGLVITALVL